MFGRKIVKRCPQGHEMELSWRRCPRCTGSAGDARAREMVDATVVLGAPPRAAAPPPPPAQPLLRATTGPLAGQELLLELGVTKIGKAPPAAAGVRGITIPDRYLSKEHATLTLGTAQLVLSDAGSTNGTFVNGERVSRAVLRDGDTVRLGESTFTVVLPG